MRVRILHYDDGCLRRGHSSRGRRLRRRRSPQCHVIAKRVHVAIRAQHLQPPVRGPQRHTKRLRDLLAAQDSGRSMAKLFCGSHHVVRMPENASDVRKCCLGCVDWCHDSRCFTINFTTDVMFDQKRSPTMVVFHANFDRSFILQFPENKIWMPKTQEKKGSKYRSPSASGGA